MSVIRTKIGLPIAFVALASLSPSSAQQSGADWTGPSAGVHWIARLRP